MKQKIDELAARIRVLEEGLEEEYHKARIEFGHRRDRMVEDLPHQQRRYKMGVIRFLRRSRLLVILTSPVIYLGGLDSLPVDGSLRDSLPADLLSYLPYTQGQACRLHGV